jgi:hypothetical protein
MSRRKCGVCGERESECLCIDLAEDQIEPASDLMAGDESRDQGPELLS